MNAIQSIPAREEYLYRQLPWDVKEEFYLLCDNLPFLLKTKPLTKAVRLVAPTVGLTEKALYERVCAYLKTGDWKRLVNKSKAGASFWQQDEPTAVPARFKEFCKGLAERFQQDCTMGHRELMIIWRTHRDSDGRFYKPQDLGYDKWPLETKWGQPAGWSLKNFLRFCPDNYDKAASRQGMFAASMFRPPVVKSRVGLKICQRVEFDDHEWNLRVHFPGQIKAMRPRGFVAAECLSAFLTPSFKPTLLDAENEVKKTLTEIDFSWFVINWLTTVGYRTDADGTWMVVEFGTSAIKEEFRKRIFRATDGKVRVSDPGMFNQPAHKGQFGGKGSGNFKHKPLVEGCFRDIDNFFSGLPGQVGLSRLACPEDAAGREQYMKQVLKAAQTLAPERAELLKLPFLNWAQFIDKAMDIIALVNRNTNHNIEGWDKLGFHANEYRLPAGDSFTPWQSCNSLIELPDPQREAINAVLQLPSPGDIPLTRARNMSREEVFRREYDRAVASGQVVKLSPWRYCDLLGKDNGTPVTVGEKNMFVISRKESGIKSKLRFLASVGNHHLKTGDKYLGFYNPWNPRAGMLICHDDGAPVGVCEFWGACTNEDEEKEMVGKQGHWEAVRKAAREERHSAEGIELQHMREHNEAVIHGTKEEKKELADMAADADAALQRASNR